MAYYSYKELCYQIPEYINKAFVDEFKRDPDGDPGYDGDYWTLAAMYVEDLIKHRDELLAALHDAATSLETIQLRSFGADSFLDDKHSMRAYAGARAAVARESMAKAKGGAANHFPEVTKMVPDGWKLVPVVATKAMWAAWDSAPCNNEDDAVNLEAAYSAMLAAAPKFEGGAE